jgi:hypothetical protein
MQQEAALWPLMLTHAHTTQVTAVVPSAISAALLRTPYLPLLLSRGQATTLKRNGSDFSATSLGSSTPAVLHVY